MNISIANKLLELRKEKNLSQEELADQIGVSRQAVSKWERAESSPDLDNLIELAKLYDISLDELLLDKESPNNEDNNESSHHEGNSETSKGKEFVSIGIDGIHVIDADGTEVHIGANGLHILDEDDCEYKFDCVFPIIITIIYLLLGFIWRLWHPGWLVFLTIPIYYGIVGTFSEKKRKKNK